MASSTPKAFERQLMDAFKRAEPKAWVHRNADIIGNGGRFAVESPPDLMVVAPGYCMLVEAKALKGTSIPFNRVAPHQLQHLLAFNEARHDAYGAVAVLRYNGQLGKQRMYDAWLIPVDEWVSLDRASERMSLPLHGKHAEYLEPWHAPWTPGVGFDLSAPIARIVRPPRSVVSPT